MYTLYKVMNISAAHKLDVDYESKCNNLHGHNWKVEVWVKSNFLNYNKMVMDFAKIKSHVMKYDHKNLNDFFDNPTAEILAEKIHSDIDTDYIDNIQDKTNANINLDILTYSVKVKVWETETSYVEYGEI